MWKILFLLPILAVCTGQGLGARETYDSISRMLSGSNYSTIWWEERAACLASLDPGVEVLKKCVKSLTWRIIDLYISNCCVCVQTYCIATVIVKVTDVSKVALDNAWQGMLHYWETRGTESDLW